MKRYREGELLRFSTEGADTPKDAAGGDGYVSCSYVEAFGVVELLQRREGFFVIEKRLALSHGYDVGDAASEIFFHGDDLLEHFLAGEVPGESFFTCCAESAGHGASNLG